MNLTYVKDYLKTRIDNITKEDVEDLIAEINAYQGTENTFSDISRVMRTVNEYNLTFLTLVQEYEAMPSTDNKFLPKRLEKAREILCVLSMLHTYLVLSLANIKESTYDMKSIRTYMSDLADKKEHYKSEKMSWVTILKSLSQEASFIVEMRRLDIEENLGYTKYKKD